ncbi:MAG TPA: alpha/beta hydrolase [Gammaproteobacteria bacterium]|nr:alpha/beta hydrolase [Gammaproteobacteria bacterium]
MSNTQTVADLAPATRYAQRDGVRLAWAALNEQGRGLPLVMVMGLGGVKEDWRHLAPALAQDRPVLIQDNRGMGESDVPEGPYDMEMLARDVYALMDAAGWQRAHLMGISMGGMIAQTMAVLEPGRCERLVLGCTSHGGRGQVPASREVLAKLDPQPGRDAEEVVRDLLRVNYTEQWLRENPDRFESLVVERFRYTRRVRGIEAQLAAIRGFDVEHRIGDLPHETLVLHGTDDILIPFANARLILQKIPRARLHPLPGCGHLFWDMDGGASITAIREFLEDAG